MIEWWIYSRYDFYLLLLKLIPKLFLHFIIPEYGNTMASAIGFMWQDYLVFATSLALTMGIGLYYGCRKNRKDTLAEYVMGSQGLWLLPVGLSLLMTYQSTTTVVGMS